MKIAIPPKAGSRIQLRSYAPVTLTLLLSISLALHAQEPKKPAAPALSASSAASSIAPPSARELSATDLEAFLDGLMPAQLEREDVAGAVVAVVKDGHVLFAKGYGFADVAKRKPVSPSDTLFRPGSISKLFTWTSVMQLVEQGKLDLDRDVNDYLDFKIPAKFGKPITLRNIMTHTTGFEEQVKDLINEEGAPIATLKQHLAEHIDHLVRAGEAHERHGDQGGPRIDGRTEQARLEVLHDLLVLAGLERPRQPDRGNVLGSDLGQRAVPSARVIAVVARPGVGRRVCNGRGIKPLRQKPARREQKQADGAEHPFL
jgi:hypothetical protein